MASLRIFVVNRAWGLSKSEPTVIATEVSVEYRVLVGARDTVACRNLGLYQVVLWLSLIATTRKLLVYRAHYVFEQIESGPVDHLKGSGVC
jgi:hypothetical protein